MDNFEYYDCKKKIIVGVNMLHLSSSLIQLITEIGVYDEDDYNDGIVEYLNLKFENKNIKQCKIQKLRLIEPEQELTVPNVKFSSIINMPSNDFQKIIRDLNNISDKLEIKSIKSVGLSAMVRSQMLRLFGPKVMEWALFKRITTSFKVC